ncbi:autotransporter domain-containing protein [Cetobacterium sp. ZOR0034]|uniref:autotransporter domain-containing protein n=1 Tax=Cetobacterium sp. ZOR0034 TaxID=1339239 RepID=UPI0006481BD5|nr:autotransporter domain-containing protein [Cetobacterium sp. ZOR0034]
MIREERVLKRFLKRKVSFNVSVLVCFLITGTLLYSNSEIVVDGKEFVNDLLITSDQNYSIGISGMNKAEIINSESGRIVLNGINSVGMSGNFSTLINRGEIETTADGALGMQLTTSSNGRNEGTIKTNGVNAMGVLILSNSKFENVGTIEVTGDAFDNHSVNSGIDVQGTATGVNNGYIKTTGEASFGIRNSGIGINGKDGVIETEGKYGTGIYGQINEDRDQGIIKNYGKVLTKGEMATGMNIDRGTMSNFGAVETTGYAAAGLRISNGVGLNEKGGFILTNGEAAKGIVVDVYRENEESEVINRGTVETAGVGANGIDSTFSTVQNDGNIYTSGQGARGITLKNSEGTNGIDGHIKTEGDRANGMDVRGGSTGSNYGKIETSGDRAKGVSVNSTAYTIKRMYENGVTTEEIFTSEKGATFVNEVEGKIITKGDKAYGVYLDSYLADDDVYRLAEELGVTLDEIDIKKAEFVNNGKIETHGEKAYGIYSSNSIATNNGSIHTRGKGAYGIYAENYSVINHNGSIHVNDPNAYGIVYDSTSTVNISKNAEIKVNGNSSNAIYMVEGLKRTLNDEKSILNSYGDITVEGDGAKGIVLSGKGEAINSGNIDLVGIDVVGMLGVGKDSTVTNSGTIALNLEDKSIAMKGESGALIKNEGTIKLKDFSEETITQKQLDTILNVDSESTLINSGVVFNSENKVVIAAGESVGESIENIEKDEVLKSDETLTITGERLEGVLNQSENFVEEPDKYLLSVNSSELNLSGTVNAGQNAIEILENSKVNFSGSVNSLGIAFELEGAELNSEGGNIVGDIVLNETNKITLSNTEIEGNILGNSGSSSDIVIENNTSLKGDILLGDGDDSLKIDSSSGNLLLSSTTIDGGLGKDNLTIGTEGELTIVKANISNFDENRYVGDVYIESSAKIVSEDIELNGSGNIKISANSNLVLGVGTSGENSLDSIEGNSITSEEGGKLILHSEDLVLDSEGTFRVDLIGTEVVLEDEDILASQFIYNVSQVESGVLEFSMKELQEIGMDSKYQDIYNSIISSDSLGDLNSLYLGNEKEFERILAGIMYKTPYTYSLKMSSDVSKTWMDAVRGFDGEVKVGEWRTKGQALGFKDSFDGEYGHESQFAGLLALGEYGIDENTGVGIAFGGGSGKVNLDETASKLESDNFYLGVFSRREIGQFKISGSLGYGKDRYESERVLENKVDYFKFDEKYDVDVLSLGVEGSYNHNISNGLSLEPKVGFRYSYISGESIDEKSEKMSMKADSLKGDIFEGEVGIQLQKEIAQYQGIKGQIFLGVGYSYLFGDTEAGVDARIGDGSRFSLEGPDFGGSKCNLTIGTELMSESGYSYGVSFTYGVGDDMQSVSGGVSLGYIF